MTQLFGVSDMTIRRDLDVLAKRGLVAKVLGLSQIAALGEVGTFITDDGLPPEAHGILTNRVGELLVAAVDGGDDG